MYYKLLLLLNVKPHESTLVRKLFTIQFFLGVATAILFTSSLTIFLTRYEIKALPVSFILSGCLLLFFNAVYSYLDERMTSPTLLKIVIAFCAALVLCFWILLNFFPFKELPLILSGFYMLIYMIVGYAFWGMASIIFNVRESRRLFSIVGAGDIPAKMLGYFSVPALVPVVGVHNLLLISIICFVIAFLLLTAFQSQGFLVEDDPNASFRTSGNDTEHDGSGSGFIRKFLSNRLVLCIALLSLISYIVFALIDFTFLSDIKARYMQESQMATFIAIFFAAGRLLAIVVKLLFSSRMISKLGLSNALLVTPVLLIVINLVIIAFGRDLTSHLYLFGLMVLLTEILRSTLQEPVFFILFQPLKPHDRLRGHLIAKGHTLPFALLPVGIFLVLYFKDNNAVPIEQLAKFLVVLLAGWIAAVFLIKKEYLKTLIRTLKKGYFRGTELFLNDDAVISLLIKKTESKKPLEVVHSLHLLERSGFPDIYKILIRSLSNPVPEIREYVLLRIIANNMTSSLPVIRRQLEGTFDAGQRSKLIKACYFLDRELKGETLLQSLDYYDRKAAMEGLLLRKDAASEQLVIDHLTVLASGNLQDKILVLDVIMECQCENYSGILRVLLNDSDPAVYAKAIECAGKTRSFELFLLAAEVAVARRAFHSFKMCLRYYGDDVFSEETWPRPFLQKSLLRTIIKTTGSIKGEHSTRLLLQLLRDRSRYSVEIIEAIWLKRSKLDQEALALLEQWFNEKAEQSKIKVQCYYEMYNRKDLRLLQQAVVMDLRKDMELLLKVSALLFDREKVDRVIELLKAGKMDKISNAIEILELTIPKRYFSQINILIELVDEITQNKALIANPSALEAGKIIDKVINNPGANFSEWTKSIACYTLPKLPRYDRSLALLDVKVSKEDYLFNETRDYVLTMLK